MTTLKKIEPEADGVLKDKQVIRVPLTMMDAQQQAVAADVASNKAFVADHHRPNSAILTDQQKREADERHAARDKAISEAWKNPPAMYLPPTAPVKDNTSLRTADPLSGGNAPGAATNAAELDAIQAANQAKYNSKIESAWKTPTNAGAK